MGIELCGWSRCVWGLRTEIAKTKTYLQQTLNEPTFTNLQNTIFNNKEKTFLQYKNSQIKKLKHLISGDLNNNLQDGLQDNNTFNTAITSSTSSSIQDKWVNNLSKKELTPEEKSLLQKRPKICSYPSNHPHQRIHLHYYCGSSPGRWTQWCWLQWPLQWCQ